VEDDGFVLVPDQTAGRAIVVDPAPGRVVASEQVGTAGRDVQLVAKDGLVFYNDVTGPDAGVVRFQNGQWSASPKVAKFAAGGAVPSLVAEQTLASSQSISGLPSPPSGTKTTTVTVPSTTSGTSGSQTTSTTTPTTTWSTTPTTTSPCPTDACGTLTTPSVTTPSVTTPSLPTSPLPTRTFTIFPPFTLAPPIAPTG
jgi:hypothetical protein